TYFCYMYIEKPCFFIVGNSRSGTTMMLRILNNHPDVFVLNELHFFEQLWSPSDKDKVLSSTEAIDLSSRLIYVQKEGYTGEMDAQRYIADAKALVKSMDATPLKPHLLYAALMWKVALEEGKQIPCEKTPQNVF